MNLVKKNIVANFVGNIWYAIINLAFIPLFVKFLGVEAYGLIGIFVTLQALFVLLDMGLSSTVTREMARLSVSTGKEQETSDLVHSLELIYWGMAVLIGIAVVTLSPLMAQHWVKASQLSAKTIEQTLRIMGLSLVLQWPSSFYTGGLTGLQRQVLINGIKIGIATLNGVGAILILWLIAPTIKAFFLWQIVMGIVNTGLLRFFLWRCLTHTVKKPVFKKSLLVGIWKFAAGMSGVTFLGTILSQIDKIVLSKLLSLEMFGYYMLAAAVAMSLYRLIGPVFFAVYPRFIQLVSLADQDGLKKFYHKSCQFMSVLVLPVATMIAMFSYQIMLIWTQDVLTANKTYLLVSILICGTALNGLMNIPYALQLAYGWTSLALFTNLISMILLIPMILWMTHKYGAVGGASTWLILNVGYFIFVIHFMHRRLLHHEKRLWYTQDVALPLFASLVIAGIGRLLVGGLMSNAMAIFSITMIYLVALVAAAMITTTTRAWLVTLCSNLKKQIIDR